MNRLSRVSCTRVVRFSPQHKLLWSSMNHSKLFLKSKVSSESYFLHIRTQHLVDFILCAEKIKEEDTRAQPISSPTLPRCNRLLGHILPIHRRTIHISCTYLICKTIESSEKNSPHVDNCKGTHVVSHTKIAIPVAVPDKTVSQ